MLTLTILKALAVIAGVACLMLLARLVYEVYQWQRNIRELDEE